MLTHCFYKAGIKIITAGLLLGLLLLPEWARTQDAVSILRAGERSNTAAATAALTGNAQAFDFARNLIFFPARIDGRIGNFILDTGAPTLLLNNRGVVGKHPAPAGLGAGGKVELANQRVESFEMGGQNLGSRWALALDLRSLENRTGKRIDGFVGHDVLRKGELRIDYPNRNFRLLPSSRNPREKERAPASILRVEYVDHLPVVTLYFGKKKLRFVVDTGAGKNLIDEKYSQLFSPSDEQVNIQGLDGKQQDCPVVYLPSPENIAVNTAQLRFVSIDLSHLQSSAEGPVAGILGSDFLAKYCVGIDYRRRKLYLW